jgi:RNA polymerase sigma-70 factor (ECF subfamily)
MDAQRDEVVAVAVQQGDADAFGELISRYEQKLKRYGRKFLSSQDDIEDLVQDVFIKAYTNIQSFDTSLRFSPWIYRIAHNTFVNELKHRGRRSTPLFDADTVLPFLPAKETADNEALRAELRNIMDELLQDLPEKYREVLILHYYEELNYQEISDVLQIPVTTVGVRLLRGRKKLQELYVTHTTP